MANLAVRLAASALYMSSSAAFAQDEASPKRIGESEIRAISAQRYTELLRRACQNGFRFRLSEIASGFRRSFAELNLAYRDQGYTVVPGSDKAELVVTRIAVEWPPKLPMELELGCFRARWKE